MQAAVSRALRRHAWVVALLPLVGCSTEPVAVELPVVESPSGAHPPPHAPFPVGVAPPSALEPYVAAVGTAVHLTAVRGTAGLLGQHEDTFECALDAAGARCDVFCMHTAQPVRLTASLEHASVARWLDDLAHLPLDRALPSPRPVPLDAYQRRSLEIRTPTAVVALDTRAAPGEAWQLGITGIGAVRVPAEVPDRIVSEIVAEAGDPCASPPPR